MEVFILVALIFVNGLFVMSEIALVSARKSRLEHQAEKGDLKARKAIFTDVCAKDKVVVTKSRIVNR